MRTASEHHRLCVGDLESMLTDSKGLLDAGVALGKALWEDARSKFAWSDMDCYIAHQVSHIHTRAMCRTLDIDPDRVPLTYPTRGNMGAGRRPVHPGDAGGLVAGRRPVVAAGCRFRAEREFRGGAVVRAASIPAAAGPPARPGPEVVPPGHRPGRRRGVAHLARARQRRGSGARHNAVCPRQPDVVLSLAPVPRPGPARVAGPRGRPVGHGLLRTHRRAAPVRAPGRRPCRPHRRPSE
jgi:3-Oxoacyl-[acyl-carrier-protein (ACP)] synthase III C terminal